MLNEFYWQNYLKSDGVHVVAMFEENLKKGVTSEYIDQICDMHQVYCPCRDITNKIGNEIVSAVSVLDEIGRQGIDLDMSSIEAAMSSLYAEISNGGEYNAQQVFGNFSGAVSYYTTILSIAAPDMFIPYYFTYNFNVVERIFEEFEIDLPCVPLKRDYEKRFYYYMEICKALNAFKEKHGMSPYELCAFLYDFAPKSIGGSDSYLEKHLPEPKGAYLIGSSENDLFLNDEAPEDSIICWQCNPDTRVGDMIVMYLKTPISSIDSIWRSVSIGFNDPFFYYYRITYISRRKRIDRVPLKQLHEDVIFKEMSIVHKNMQGVNGVEMRPSEYNHLVEISGADVPVIEFVINNDGSGCSNEKDVEKILIEPLLKKLGYSKDDYCTQLYVELGNHNHTLIPDFVILPVKKRGQQTATAILEAKFSIPSSKEMEEVKIQARSYARQLNTKYSVIASKDKVWVFSVEDDYSNEILSLTWGELKIPDNFSNLMKLIGKDRAALSSKCRKRSK